jgi:septal ring factor EnvC (AmiA/AmiB activator)
MTRHFRLWRSLQPWVTPRGAAAVVLSAVLLLSGDVLGAPQRDDDDLKRVRDEIARMKRRLEGVRKETKTAEQELEAIELELAIHRREYQMAIDIQRDLERDRSETEQQIVGLTETIARQKQFLSMRLGALYRLGRLSYFRIALAAEGVEDPLEAASMLAYLVGRDARAVARYQSTRERLGVHRSELVTRTAAVRQAQAIVAERRTSVEKSRQEKAVLLARLRSESTLSAQKLAELQEKARRLESLFKLLYEQSEGAGASGNRIADFKGALEWPVKGDVIERFGKQRSEKFATYTASNGIRIAAPAGTEVRAVFEGTVLYSQWFKGYGNLVIVDHGERVFSLYGNTRGVVAAAGDRLLTGQALGVVAEGEDGAAGYLYFEVREDNRPIDPEGWLR